MDETKKTGDKTEMKHESHEHKHEHASEHKHDEKKETVVQKPKVKKENAVARGDSLHIS